MPNIYIEGDKSGFNSKTAVDRFKLMVKKSTDFNLDNQDLTSFIKPEYKIELVNKTDEELKFSVNKKTLTNEKSDHEVNKDLLKNKLRNMYNLRTNISYYKAKQNKNVPENILAEYKKLVKVSKIPVIDPNEVIENPDKYKSLISMLISNEFIGKMPHSHPYVKYYKLIAEKIGANPILPTATNNFLNNMSTPEVPDNFYELCKKLETSKIKGNDINKDNDTEEEVVNV
jgi:hypothetical protein